MVKAAHRFCSCINITAGRSPFQQPASLPEAALSFSKMAEKEDNARVKQT